MHATRARPSTVKLVRSGLIIANAALSAEGRIRTVTGLWRPDAHRVVRQGVVWKRSVMDADADVAVAPVLVHTMRCSLGAGLTLWGRSRAADATAFVVPELQLGLDGGCVIASAKLATVLLTHTHADHCFRVTHLTSRQKPPDILAPRALLPHVQRFIDAGVLLSGCVMDDESMVFDKSCNLIGVAGGDTMVLRANREIRVRVFAMEHSVPCVGYGVSRVRSKLAARFRHLSGPEIAVLRKADPALSVLQEVEERLFVFCGDTTPEVFATCPELLLYPVVIVECSFINDCDRAKAAQSKHTLWSDLRPIVVANAHVRFVLIHFSMRYTKAEIRAHFEREALPNAEIMLQDDGDAFGSTFGADQT